MYTLEYCGPNAYPSIVFNHNGMENPIEIRRAYIMRTSHDTYVVRDGNVVADADFTSCIEDAAPIDV